MTFRYTEDTPISIDGKTVLLRMENGMTGIGSRAYWINGEKKSLNLVTHSDDITKSDHSLYRMKWRDQPWDLVAILIAKEFEEELLSEGNSWREPKKIEIL